MITLEVGKYYKSRCGVIFGPISNRSDESKTYLFKSGGYSWVEHGFFSVSTENHPLDLIEEVSIYPAQPYKYGEMIEVSDDGVSWVKSRFLILNSTGLAATENEKNMSVSWLHHRPIQPVPSREEVIQRLKQFNEWRRGKDDSVIPLEYPGQIGKILDRAIELLEESK
jgi:hypothetical protein